MNSDEKLQFSELRYRRLFETAQDGILILDSGSGQIVDVNPFLKKLLNYSEKELLGKELWQIGVFKDIVDSKTAFLELKKRGYIRYKDLPLETKNGNLIDVEFISNVYSVGNLKVIQCNIRDITSRKQAEDAVEARTRQLEDLTKSQEETKRAMMNVMEDLEKAKTVIEVEKAKDEAILASIGEGLVAVDNLGRIMIMNKVAENMLDLKIKDVFGKKITSFLLEDEAGIPVPFDKRPTTIALKTKETSKVNYYYVRRDKTRFPIAITATPIKLDGKTIGLVEIVRDITQEMTIDKAKSEFVSLASHQLRTPLGITKWYLEALENEDYVKDSPETVRKYFNQVYNNNERVLNLVRDLLSVSRIEQGRVKNIVKPSNITNTIKDVVRQMQIIAHKKDVDLHLYTKGVKIPLINIDILRFHEVIQNLTNNAIEYAMAGDSVYITVKKLFDTILISVKDTGIGISDADQKKLFTKFFRGEKAIEHNPEGSGLGLYVVKSYIEGWGGKISVESVVGQGTTFNLTLPLTIKEVIEK